ncbi:MAG: hypothetical protein WC241_04155, partial [Candidatus Paceibacterota bacterium]
MKKQTFSVTLLMVLLLSLGTSAWALSGRSNEVITGIWTFEKTPKFASTSLNGVTYTWPAADGTAGQQLTTNGSGTLSWAAAGSGTAWDDLTAPDANKTHAFTTFTSTFTGTSVAADQWTFSGRGDFGDVSVVRIESSTGNPTDGTVLEVVSHDANVDPLVVTASGVANALVVSQDGTVDIASALDVGGNLTVTGNLAVTGTWTNNAVAATTAGATLTLDGKTTGGVNIGSISTGAITLSRSTSMADGTDLTIGEGVLTIDNDQVNETALVITSDATTTGGGISVVSAATTGGKGISVVADSITTGDVLYLESSAAGLTTGNYINCYNGAATVFEVGLYGATTITGNASTDILTITAGDI